MKNSFLIILFALMMPWGLFSQQVMTVIEEAQCSIIAPDTLGHMVKTVETPVGNLLLHQYLLKQTINDQPVRYSLQYCDYPPGTIHHDSTELLKEFFEATAESSAKAVLGKLDYMEQQTTFGFPGMVWRISYDKGKGLIKSKAFVKGSRYFNLKVEYPRSLSLYQMDDKFFNSFRFEDTAEY